DCSSKRPQVVKAAIELTRLHNKARALAAVTIATELGHFPTDQVRRVGASAAQRCHRQTRRRGLTMGAADSERAPPFAQAAHRFRVEQRSKALPHTLLNFGIRKRHGSTADDIAIGAINAIRLAASPDLMAFAGEARNDRTTGTVTTADDAANSREQSRQTAHAGTTNTNEVEALGNKRGADDSLRC